MSEKTVRIRLLTSVAGGVTYAAGDEVLETQALAADLVNAGYAEYIDTKQGTPAARANRATAEAPKNAEKR